MITFFVVTFFQSCHEKGSAFKNSSLEWADYDGLRDSSLVISESAIKNHIKTLCKNDRDSMLADAKLRSFYTNRPSFLWINRFGVTAQADTLLEWLSGVEKMGFSPRRFCIPQISDDLQALRSLQFDEKTGSINQLLARLEYQLTKAFLRYATGQRFGFTNPQYALNHFDVKKRDSLHVEYHRLFDIPMDRPDKFFFEKAVKMVTRDSLDTFLASVQPHSALFERFAALLGSGDSVQHYGKPKLLCNLERCRWRLKDKPSDHEKYVFVNIPAFSLLAVDGDSVMTMRVGCGTVKTKTPLLTSRIKRMDVNPQWIIPRSIVEKDIVRHVGNPNYFASRHYFVRHRKTGRNIPIEQVTYGMLMNRDYMVLQEGGAGNSLGRIIFRFDNNFSVYLHDTSSPAFFSNDNRGVSHGCVRVQRPFDLAVFLLKDKDETLIDRIRYSMTADVSSLGSNRQKPQSEQADTLDRSRLISSHTLEDEVPVFLTYYTLYPDVHGAIRSYGDVYGYDQVLYNQLKPYVE
ncbi:MAG: L,D-transpeptidase family protein [Prevotella sp.]|nr:L,D-transpeptidase family protein [Prevotella sp.]